MKYSKSLVLILFSHISSAQFSTQWELNLNGPQSILYGRAEQAGDYIYFHQTYSSVQYGRQIGIDGIEGWVFENNTFTTCSDCIFAEAYDIDVSPSGLTYGVGMHTTFSYNTPLLYKVNAEGSLVYSREYPTITFSGQFNSVREGIENQDVLYVSGEQFESSINTIGPKLYKVDAVTGDILQQVYLGDIGFSSDLIKLEIDASDQIYANVSSYSVIEYISYNSNLEPLWQYTDSLTSEAGFDILPRPVVLENGNIVFFSTYKDGGTGATTLRTDRFTSSGELLGTFEYTLSNNSLLDFRISDAAFGADGTCAFFLQRRNMEGGGKGIPGSIEPLLIHFNAAQQVDWTYTYQDNSAFPNAFDYPNRVFIDENGYTITSYSMNENDNQPGLNERNLTFLLIDTLGAPEFSIAFTGDVYRQNIGMLDQQNSNFIAVIAGEVPGQTGMLNNTAMRIGYDYNTGFVSHPNSSNQNLIYPNPASDYCFFKNPSDRQERLNIFNAACKLVYSETIMGNATIQIPLSDYAPGLYCIQIGNRSSKLLLTKP